MKRAALFCAVLALLWTAGEARPVTPGESRKAAAAFWTRHLADMGKTADTAALQPIALDGLNHIFAYRLGDDGFVVVAGDDCLQPILAYSFDTPFPDTPHPGLSEWLSAYDRACSLAADGDYPPSADWEPLYTDSVPAPQPGIRVPVMITTQWNQSAPYNQLCPYDEEKHERTVVGCVATAMAQIMKYWNHPYCGTGSYSYSWRNYGTLSADFGNTTYIWEHMPYQLSNNSRETSRDAVQTLSYHCGVSVGMMYGPSSTGGSGAYSYRAAEALTRYFKYKPTLRHLDREDYTDSVWLGMIDSDLAAGRPIYYTGRDSAGGHAFVLDGADGHGRYHFNWGWGGYGDGYFAIDHLAPGGGGAGSNATNTFNLDQGAIFGIEPIAQQYDTVDLFDTVCTTSFYYEFHEYKLPPEEADYMLHHLDTVFRTHVALAPKRFIHLDPNGGEGSTYTSSYCYLTGAKLPQAMFYRPGYRFVGWCLDIDGHDSIYQPGELLLIKETRMVYAIWQDTHSVTPDPVIDGDTTTSTVISVYPNPSQGKVSITTGSGEASTCTLYDATGRMVGQWVLRDGKGKIDLQGLPEGVYVLWIDDGEHRYNRRIVKGK